VGKSEEDSISLRAEECVPETGGDDLLQDHLSASREGDGKGQENNLARSSQTHGRGWGAQKG